MSYESPNTPPIRILHLSDVHFSASKAWDADVVLQALLPFIKKEVEAGLTPDLVVITGDLASSGKSDEYQQARNWLDKLLEIFAPGLARDHLLLIPGNHDANRSKVCEATKLVQRGLLDSQRENAMDNQTQQQKLTGVLMGDGCQLLIKRHDAYLDFVSEWYGTPQLLPWWQRVITIRGTRLHVAGLDSALLSHSRDDRNHLLIGRYQLHETVLAQTEPDFDWRLALIHHPLDYLAEWDGLEARRTIHQHCDLMLRGHLHAPQTERILPPDPQRACLELAAGALYENSQYPNAFQWIELHPQPRRVRLLYRAWLHGAWTTDRNQPGCPEGTAEYRIDAVKPETPTTGPGGGSAGTGHHYQAQQSGNGAIALGAGAEAIGAGGVSVRGNNSGDIITGLKIDTHGGAYVAGQVTTGGDFISGDKIIFQSVAGTGDSASPADETRPELLKKT